ncbi:hypothetical protein B0H11DRAFT_2211911 [Mycena galericulata]|nr:hypothetical protein B0H11DRAFT_2211911 [Mycena galericulata]
MANTTNLAAARSRRRSIVAEQRQTDEELELVTSPLSTAPSAEQPLDFPTSDTSMAAPSDDGFPDAISEPHGRTTRSTRKRKSNLISDVELSDTETIYMFSLRAKNKKNATPKKKGKMTTIDLDNDDDEGEDDDDEGVAAGEKQALTELEAEYKKCAWCGPSHLCKIDRSGTHVHLTFPQRRAWAVSLACGTNKVTKTTPPQSELFSMFHGKAKGASPPAPGAYPPNPWYQQMPMAPLGFVIDFIETLIPKSPQREGLRAVGDILDSLHFFDINEIQDLTGDELGSDKYGSILVGDAQYLLKQVKSEVKRLDKAARRARPQ